jgi:hypothetical protein
MAIAGAWALVYRRQPHLRHQAPHPAATNSMAHPLQMAGHLAAAIPRAVHEHLVDHGHQRQRGADSPAPARNSSPTG